MKPARKDSKDLPLAPRSAARLAAIQALYQMDLAQTDVNDVIGEFIGLRFGANADDPDFKDDREAIASKLNPDRIYGLGDQRLFVIERIKGRWH